MSKKRKATIRLDPGEAYIVGSIPDLEYIAFVYRELAEQAESEEDRQRWICNAEWIELEIHRTAYIDEDEKEEWN